eukprot:5623101-Alexandrium_andersonii.AAC.1
MRQNATTDLFRVEGGGQRHADAARKGRLGNTRAGNTQWHDAPRQSGRQARPRPFATHAKFSNGPRRDCTGLSTKERLRTATGERPGQFTPSRLDSYTPTQAATPPEQTVAAVKALSRLRNLRLHPVGARQRLATAEGEHPRECSPVACAISCPVPTSCKRR